MMWIYGFAKYFAFVAVIQVIEPNLTTMQIALLSFAGCAMAIATIYERRWSHTTGDKG